MGASRQTRSAISLLESRTMSSQRYHATRRVQNFWSNGFPEGRIDDIVIDDVMDRHGFGRDWPAGIYETGAVVIRQ